MNYKNRLPFIIVSMILPLLLLSLTAPEAQAVDKPVIVCTTSAIGSIVEEFLGDIAEVLVLVQPGLCPADFDLKPGYIDAVSKAQILFKQNITGEFWLAGLIEVAENLDLAVVTIPGVYNTPEGAKKYIREVGGNLSRILHVNLESKTSEMLSDVDKVAILISNKGSALDAPNVKIICMGWLKPFIESAGFSVVATFNPPETLSAGDITSLIETAKAEGVALIVDNLQIDTEFGAGIASEVGAEHVVLTNFPGAVPNTKTLSEMLKYNAEQLFNATVAYQSASTLQSEKKYLQNQLTILQMVASLAVIIAIVEAVLLYAKRRKKTRKLK